MKITIEPVVNGAILQNNEKEVYVFDEENLTGLVEILYSISDSLCNYSRYSKERIQIQIVHGDKYDCKDKKCDICKNSTFLEKELDKQK